MKGIHLAVLNLLFLATCHAFTTSFDTPNSVTATGRSPALFARPSDSSNPDRRGAIVSLVSLPFLLPSQAVASSSGARIDVNNALAREYTAFPGLFPTVATKIVQGAPYKSKKEVYAVLNELESDRLKQYDDKIIILKPDPQLKQFKTSQICKYECGNRVSSTYQQEQMKAVQNERRVY